MVISAKELKKYLKGIDYKPVIGMSTFDKEGYLSLNKFIALYDLAEEVGIAFNVILLFEKYAMSCEIEQFLYHFGDDIAPEHKEDLETALYLRKCGI